MKIKKELLFAVLATFCLTATLFMIVPTKSQTGYDARTDVNGDGTIDMADISMGIEGFMATGDPTLPVNITKHATRIINAAIGVFVAPTVRWSSDYFLVDGYSKVTVCVDMMSGGGVYTLWCWAGDYETDPYTNFIVDQAFNITDLVRTYDVPNRRISVTVLNSSPSVPSYLFVDIYLVA